MNRRKRKPKVLCHYAKEDDSTRCFVRLFKLYNSKCPKDHPPDALYLTPLRNVWSSKVPLGHNLLSKVVGTLMKDTGYEGHYTNHSVRVTCASRLFDAEVDEQLILARATHSSTDDVRTYKWASTKLQELISDALNLISDSGASAKCKCQERVKVELESHGERDS